MTTNTVQTGVCNVPNRTVFAGDNLDVMRGMNDGCVDLIYLDRAFGSDWDCGVVVGSGVAGLDVYTKMRGTKALGRHRTIRGNRSLRCCPTRQ